MSKSSNITWHEGNVSRDLRRKQLGHGGATVWLTGLSGSGKSTVACMVEKMLIDRKVNAYRLDGDNIRHGLSGNLGFSPEDRAENIRRVSEVSKLMADACVVVLASFVSPYRADREAVRKLHDASGLPFVEVYVKVPLDIAEQRDPKGLYKKARAGEIKNFTGIDDPYEAPEHPELVLETDQMNVERCAAAVVGYLEKQHII